MLEQIEPSGQPHLLNRQTVATCNALVSGPKHSAANRPDTGHGLDWPAGLGILTYSDMREGWDMSGSRGSAQKAKWLKSNAQTQPHN